MQTPLNKRVIGRHVGQKRKGSRAKSAQSGLEQAARSIDSGTDSAAATGRHSLWPPSAMQMICRGRLLPACLPACHSCLPLPQFTCPFACLEPATFTASLGHLLGGRATKIKTKQRFPIKATTWPPGNVATPPARATIQCDSIRLDSGLVAKESHNSRPVIMRQMRAALAARSSTSPSPSRLLLALPTL